MSKSYAGYIFGVWLSGIFAASFLGRMETGGKGGPDLLMLVAALIWPMLYFLGGRVQFMPRRLPGHVLAAIVLFWITCVLSAFFSPIIIESTGYVVLTFVAMWLVLQFNSNLDAYNYEIGLKVYAFLNAALLVSFAVYDYVPGQRLGNGKDILNPNTVALIATSVMVTSMAVRSVVLRIVVMGAALVTLVLTGSRGATIGALVGLCITSFMRFRKSSTKSRVFAMICILAVGMVALMFADQIGNGLNKFFALQDRQRGFGSGVTGRSLVWQETWQLFLSNPVLGVGFRAHERFLKIGSSAHNGYLATLAEIGLIGFSCLTVIIVSGMLTLWRKLKDPRIVYVGSILFGLACGYLFLACFERYLINVGNPTSVLFLLAILMPAAAMEERQSSEASKGTSETDLTRDRRQLKTVYT